MSLTIPENRALLKSIAIPSRPPFGRTVIVQELEEGVQFVSSSSRSGSARTSRVVGGEGGLLSAGEVRGIQPKAIPIDLEPTRGLEKFEQSRTLVAQFTSDGTTGDIAIDLGNAPFNGNITSVQVEVSETLVGTAALAVRSENGQSVFQGTGLTEAGVLDLEPDFVAVGLFADPLFVPVSNVPVIAGEGIILVMRLAGTVIAGAVRAFVSVTLQGVGEDLSKQILLRASVAAPPPSAVVAISPGAAPAPRVVAAVAPGAAPAPVVAVTTNKMVGALVKFSNWMAVTGVVPVGLDSRLGGGNTQLTVPRLGGEWVVRLSLRGNTLVNDRIQESLTGVKAVVLLAAPFGGEFIANPDRQARRQFLEGRMSAFRALSNFATVEFILDPQEIGMFKAGAVPARFQDEFGARLAVSELVRGFGRAGAEVGQSAPAVAPIAVFQPSQV